MNVFDDVQVVLGNPDGISEKKTKCLAVWSSLYDKWKDFPFSQILQNQAYHQLLLTGFINRCFYHYDM